MGASSYENLVDEIFALYARQEHAEALRRLRSAAPDLPQWRSDTAHLAACLLAVSGDPAGAFEELRAALDEGAWWHKRILVDDDDLAALRPLPGFDELVAVSHARCLAAGEEALPPLIARPSSEPLGVLVALHGAGGDAAQALDEWRGAADAAYVVVAVASSQRNTPTYRSWPDATIGLRDIGAALQDVAECSGTLPIVAAGFSAGGRQAMQWALAATAPAPSRFVVMAPAVHPADVEAWPLEAACRRGVTGTILVGEADDDVLDGVLATHAHLVEAGVQCTLECIEGLGHAYPDDFSERLRTALAG